MKTVDVRVHNTPEPICLRIVLPSERAGAKTTPENFGPGARPILSTALMLHIEVREAQPVGRPVAARPEDVAALLPPEGYTFAGWKRATLDGGLSLSTFKRLRKRALEADLAVEREGRYFSTAPKP